jgi:hypothetical protein
MSFFDVGDKPMCVCKSICSFGSAEAAEQPALLIAAASRGNSHPRDVLHGIHVCWWWLPTSLPILSLVSNLAPFPLRCLW